MTDGEEKYVFRLVIVVFCIYIVGTLVEDLPIFKNCFEVFQNI